MVTQLLTGARQINTLGDVFENCSALWREAKQFTALKAFPPHYWWYLTTVLNILQRTDDIPHSAEHPLQYWWYIPKLPISSRVLIVGLFLYIADWYHSKELIVPFHNPGHPPQHWSYPPTVLIKNYQILFEHFGNPCVFPSCCYCALVRCSISNMRKWNVITS